MAVQEQMNYLIFNLRKRGVPTLELKYPKNKDETTDMVNKINTFLDSLPKSLESSESSKTSENSEILEISDNPDISSNKKLKEDE